MGGKPVDFIMLTLTYLHQGQTHQMLPMHMSPDQARTVAMQLLSVVEKAESKAPTGTKH